MYRPAVTKLNRNEALIYLGYRGGQVPPDVEETMEEMEDILLSNLRPRAVYRILELEDGRLKGCAFQPEGEDIGELLAPCRQVVLMAATLGAEIDGLLMRTEIYDMSRAVILDALASVAIEAVCDDLEEHLRQKMGERGLYLTDRFSPGYGDMPIEQQRDFCTALDTHRQIGLTVSSSGMLLPGKSVTALIGVADAPQPKRSRGCQHCTMFRNCAYRKEGITCGK